VAVHNQPDHQLYNAALSNPRVQPLCHVAEKTESREKAFEGRKSIGFPAARLGDTTATGDAITGPGGPDVLIAGVPVTTAVTVGAPTGLISP
jgi:hypothetical protein